jgi:hypothetical protein
MGHSRKYPHSPRRKFLPSRGGGEKKLFLIIVNVLGHPKGGGGLTSNFLRGVVGMLSGMTQWSSGLGLDLPKSLSMGFDRVNWSHNKLDIYPIKTHSRETWGKSRGLSFRLKALSSAEALVFLGFNITMRYINFTTLYMAYGSTISLQD